MLIYKWLNSYVLKFTRFCRPYVGGSQGCRAFTPEERNDFFWAIVEMGGFNPAMAKIIDSLDYLGVSVICGIDENLTGDDAGYYAPARGGMFFKAGKITSVAVQHEFLHIAQHRILGYDMISSGCKRNMEFEVDMAIDIMHFMRYGGDEPVRGRSSGNYGQLVKGMATGEYGKGEIERLFHDLIKEYPYYQDESYCSNYKPHLIDFILRYNRD